MPPIPSTTTRRPAYQQASLLTNPVTQKTAAIQALNKLRKAPFASAIERRQIARDLVGQLGHVSTRVTLAGTCRVLRNVGVPVALVAFLEDDSMADALATTVEQWGRSWVRRPAVNATAGLATGVNVTAPGAGLRPPARRWFFPMPSVAMFGTAKA